MTRIVVLVVAIAAGYWVQNSGALQTDAAGQSHAEQRCLCGEFRATLPERDA